MVINETSIQGQPPSMPLLLVFPPDATTFGSKTRSQTDTAEVFRFLTARETMQGTRLGRRRLARPVRLSFLPFWHPPVSGIIQELNWQRRSIDGSKKRKKGRMKEQQMSSTLSALPLHSPVPLLPFQKLQIGSRLIGHINEAVKHPLPIRQPTPPTYRQTALDPNISWLIRHG